MPAGIDIPGRPAKLVEIVKMSSRYIFTGSSPLELNPNAGVGDVGPTIKSTSLNAAVKSFLISLRTC